MSEIIWYLSFSDWLFSLSIMFSWPSILSQRVKFSSFLMPSSIPLCKCPIVVLPTHLWTLGLLPNLGDCKQCCNEHGVLMFFQISGLSFCGYIPRRGITRSKGSYSLAGVAQWIECQPANQRVACLIPVRAHAWVVGQVSMGGTLGRQPHIDDCLFRFLPPFPSV